MSEDGGDIQENCVVFNQSQVAVIVLTRISVSGLAFLACLTTLLLISVLACLQKMLTTFVGRMKLYITTVALILSLMYLMQVLPVTTGEVLRNNTNGTIVERLTRIKTKSEAWDTACDTVASFIMYVNWVMLLLIGWMVLVLLCYTRSLGVIPNTPQSSGHTTTTTSSGHWKWEVVGVLFVLVFPLLVAWVPYVTDNYGLGSRWCGITLGSSCSEIGNRRPPEVGLFYLLLLWYTPSLIIALMGTIGLAVIVHRFRTYYKNNGFSGHTCSAIVKGIPPITYLVVYNVINVFNMTETTIYSISTDPQLRFSLTVAHAVSGPCKALAVPFAFVLSQLIIYQCFKRRRAYIPLP